MCMNPLKMLGGALIPGSLVQNAIVKTVKKKPAALLSPVAAALGG